MNFTKVLEWLRTSISKRLTTLLLGAVLGFGVLAIIGYVFNKPELICPIQEEVIEELVDTFDDVIGLSKFHHSQ